MRLLQIVAAVLHSPLGLYSGQSRMMRFLQRLYWRFWYWQTGRRVEKLRRSGALAYCYPNVETLEKLDDASLFSKLGLCAWRRYDQEGFTSLNEVERVLYCLFTFEGEVNNGGFGQWLWSVCPETLNGTLIALKTVGASKMSDFVTAVCTKLGDTNRFASREQWTAYLDSLPDSFHESLEPLSVPFVELEPEFLACGYAYTRQHWRAVRPSNTIESTIRKH